MENDVKRTAGYSFVEMVVVVGIIGILLLVAVSNRFGQSPARNLERITCRMASDLNAARAGAVSRCGPVTVAMFPESKRYSVWEDSNTNGVADAGEVNEVSFYSVPGAGFLSSQTGAVFSARGCLAGQIYPWRIRLWVDQAGTNAVVVMQSGQVIRLEGTDAAGL